ncbi:hypothetical protein D9M69_607190 [compost metagenome]
MIRWGSRMACAQKERSGSIWPTSSPCRDLNHCRSWSTKATSAMGALQIEDASSVRLSKAASGRGSRTPMRCRRSDRWAASTARGNPVIKSPFQRKTSEHPRPMDRGMSADQDGKRSAWEGDNRDTCT